MPRTSIHPLRDENTRRLLRGADWGSIGVRLTAYALQKARNLRWRTGRNDALAAGLTAEDIAAEAVRRLMDGTRSWDPNQEDLFSCLRGIVDSLTGHLAVSFDNRMIERLPDESHTRSDQDLDGVSGELDPHDQIARLYEVVRANGQDALLVLMDAVVACGESKPQVLADYLKVDVSDIYNRLKRLRRLADSIMTRASKRKEIAGSRFKGLATR